MALYGPAIKKLIPPGPTDPPIKPRVVILHVAVSEQPSLHDYFNGPSGGVESHFYIRRDGTVEQYRDTSIQADANTDANNFAISIETQGLEAGEWTPEQIDAIKALILWCHDTHGIPLQRCSAWDGAGIGYHTLFPGRWDKRGASCPGPDRKLQFNQIISPWLAEGGKTTPEDDMFDEAKYGPRIDNASVMAQAASVRTQRIEAALRALAASLPEATAKAVTDALNANYEAEITLTPKDA